MCQGKHTVLTHAMLLFLWTRIKTFWKFSGTRGELCIPLYNTAMLLSKNPATAENREKEWCIQKRQGRKYKYRKTKTGRRKEEEADEDKIS